MQDQATDVIDYSGILRRRRGVMLIAAGVLTAVSVAVALLLPPVYRSTATILIEEQEIPSEMVRSTITSYADERMQVISQQIMTRSVLMGLVEKYGLYPAKRKHETSEEILDRMRKDIKLSPVTADVTDRRSGSRISSTIAFTLSYDNERPDAAQKVTNELVSLYLNENLTNRAQKAAETSSFLSDEAGRLRDQLAEIEGRIAVFKKKNLEQLPELSQMNLQSRDRTDSELLMIDRKIAGLEDRKITLQGQLDQINPNGLGGPGNGGDMAVDPAVRLKTLKVRLATMSGVYSPDHPDMIRMRQEIDALQKAVGEKGAAPGETGARLSRLKADLAAARQKYSDDHPDVVKLRKTIATLEEKAGLSSAADPVLTGADDKPDNPLYVTLRTQLDSVDNELDGQRKLRKDMQARLDAYEVRLLKTPQVEREYLELARERENALVKYKEIKDKQLEAQVAQELEKDRKGERFSLIDPPEFPEKSHSPNRPAIILLGLVLSLGGAIGYAGILEFMDGSVRDSRMLSGSVAAPLLAVIPYRENTAEAVRRKSVKKIKIAIMLLLMLAAVLFIQFFIMPLDVLWYVVSRKLGWM